MFFSLSSISPHSIIHSFVLQIKLFHFLIISPIFLVCPIVFFLLCGDLSLPLSLDNATTNYSLSKAFVACSLLISLRPAAPCSMCCTMNRPFLKDLQCFDEFFIAEDGFCLVGGCWRSLENEHGTRHGTSTRVQY